MVEAIPVTKAEILTIYRPVAANAHKGTQGHALLIGGSYGKMGSVCLLAKAALQSGCGLVTAFIPKCGYVILQTLVPEAMAITDRNKEKITRIRFDIAPKAIGIGPGMGVKRRTQKAFHKFLKTNKAPLVIDADALNILSQNKEWLGLLPPKTILTPHHKELERLIGSFASDEQKTQMALEFARQYDLVLVMKGAPSFILHGGKMYKNTSGNPALATAGSGDVLTGIITSLLAQGYAPDDAAVLGVYIHGRTADIGILEIGAESFIASDICAFLGKAYLELSQSAI